MNMNNRRLVKSLGVVLVAGCFAGGAWAGSAISNLSVTATVPQNCLISTNAVAFGNYDPVLTNSSSGTALTGTGSVSVTCTRSSIAVSIALGSGANNPSGSMRQMLGGTGGTSLLTYELYQPSATTPGASCPGTTVWNTGVGIFTPTGVNSWGATSPKTFNVCGTVPSGQDVSAGSYTDLVVATINF